MNPGHPLDRRAVRRTAARALCSSLLVAAACAGPGSPPTETIAIRVHEGTTLAFDISPDGRTIVFDLLGQLWELPAGGGDARALTDAVRDTAEDLDPSYAPDGRHVVWRGERGGRTGLWLFEPGGGAPAQLTQLDNPEGYEGAAAWSPDGKEIVFARLLLPDDESPEHRTRLISLDLATHATRELPMPEQVGPLLRDPTWEPGGRRLAVVAAPAGAARGGRIWLVDADGGHATPLTAEKSETLSPVFAPDGKSLAFFAPDDAHRMQVWILRTGAPGDEPLLLTSHDDVAATRVRFSPDGGHVIYSADGRLWKVPVPGGMPQEIPFTAELALVRPRTAVAPVRFPGPGAGQTVRAFMGLALSPDARSVAMLALGKLWVMPVGGAPRAVAEVPLSAHHLVWSPDGATTLWSAGPWREQDLFATDVATGTTRRVTALPGREDLPLYAPDGRHLAFTHEPTENESFVRVIDAGAAQLADAARSLTIDAQDGVAAAWTPESDALLYTSGGFGRGPNRAAIIPLSGTRRDVSGMPDSPLWLQWAAGSLLFVRHARLWKAPLDATGVIGPAEPLGDQPAIYCSAARDGTVLYISEGGLRLRRPDGKEQRLGWPLSYTVPGSGPILIRNARVIDGTGVPATPPRDLLIQDGRFRRIVAAGSIDPGSARVLDVEGRYVIPGLMDLHAHVYRPELLPGYAYFGVTTVRDQGSPIGPLVAYADAIAAGLVEGPRVDYGGFQFYSDWAYDAEDGQGVEPEADPNHVARSIELAQVFGSQHIKTRTFRRWDINARFITEAHRRGMRVTGHCAHLLPLVAAGIDAKEHAGFCEPRGNAFIYDDLVQLYRAAGIAVIPTITYSAFAVELNRKPDLLDGDAELAPFVPPRDNFGWMIRLNEPRRREFADFATWARQATGRLARAGVTIGTGSDIWQIPTGAHMELEEMVRAGLTPLQAIVAGTGGAARIVGAESELGTIEEGKWADLVVLDGDPVADIRNTRRIRAVLQSGRLLDREALLARFRDPEATRH